MSGFDDYFDEMRDSVTATDAQLDELLSGDAPARGETQLDDLAEFVDAARVVLLHAPDPVTENSHLAAAVETAQAMAAGNAALGEKTQVPTMGPPVPAVSKWRRIVNRTKWVSLRLAAATTAASASLIGVAYAGVDLPGSVPERALEAVLGIELPNQAGPQGGRGAADEVHAIIDSDLERGCTFGQAVAEAARGDHGGGRGPDHDPCAKGAEGRARGEERSAPGRARAEEARGEGRGKGDEKSSGGRATADEASGGRSESAGDSSAGDLPEDASGGEEASSEGRGNNPNSGGEPGPHTGDEASSDAQSNNPSSGDESGPHTGDEASSEARSNNPSGNGNPSGGGGPPADPGSQGAGGRP